MRNVKIHYYKIDILHRLFSTYYIDFKINVDLVDVINQKYFTKVTSQLM